MHTLKYDTLTKWGGDPSNRAAINTTLPGSTCIRRPPAIVNRERARAHAQRECAKRGPEEQNTGKHLCTTPVSISPLKYLQVSKLLHGVGRVGDELPQEDLFVGVDRVRHDVQQLPRLRLELQFLRRPARGKRGKKMPQKERRAHRYRYAEAFSLHHCRLHKGAAWMEKGKWHDCQRVTPSVGVVSIMSHVR